MAKYSRHDESVLHPATSKSNSLITTVPAHIVNQFDLKNGDNMSWCVGNRAVVIQMAPRK
jgi:antitoxin component of MazEF toxin-antitoxin module